MFFMIFMVITSASAALSRFHPMGEHLISTSHETWLSHGQVIHEAAKTVEH
jgi:hypothetical protein